MALTKIDIAVLNQGWIRTELVNRLLRIVSQTPYDISVSYPNWAPISNNRNRICKVFREGDADFLLMTDADQCWEKNPLDLVEEDLDMVGFPTHVYQPAQSLTSPIKWNIIKLGDVGLAPVEQVKAIGSGSLLIARRVLVHSSMRAPFADKFDEDGIRISSEDMWFCEKVRAAGFKIWMASGNPCHHMKPVDLLYMDRLLKERQPGNSTGGTSDNHSGVAHLGKKLRDAVQWVRGTDGDTEGE